MLSEMIDKIAELSAETDSLALLYETPRKRAYDDHGKIVIDPKDIPSRSSTVFSLPSLVEAIKAYSPGTASVWVAEGKIVVLLNDAADSYRDDRLTMNLPLSPFFGVLAKSAWLEQKAIIDMIRHDLCGTVIEPENTLNLLRQLKFTSSTEVSGTITNTSAALGKSAMAEVTGLGALPDTVKVEFSPYPSLREILDADVTVDCTLFAEAATAKLRLAPRPGELEAAKLTAMQLVQAKLVSQVGTVPVYLGEP